MIDAKLFMKIINDPSFYEFKKMQYKYGQTLFGDALKLLKTSMYETIPIVDFNNKDLVYCPIQVNIQDKTYKSLLGSTDTDSYNMSQMENEIESTLAIENIESSRNSIRNILNGEAPSNQDEDKIFGIKKGLDFISDKNNAITEENIYELYMSSIGMYLEDDENKLLPNKHYRHDTVYIVGSGVNHQGLNHKLLDKYMKQFIEFISKEDKIDVIIKSVIIHFYFAYLHPYFDGNGRMARLLQLWYLVQNDFNAALMVSFSQLISKTKNLYYKSFEIIEENLQISKVLDVTPFILYFNDHIFSNLKSQKPATNILETFDKCLKNGDITIKEKELFMFVLSNYQDRDFSTKDIEKDYKNAAYATIRNFVLKFEKLKILTSQKYGNRVRYKLAC